ncbi:MAG: hypothetical protein BMS9Abin04_272 [Planctomycetia bacterium]|nr:MAG: hypothetical protein BMS9Abin04_272 [Planctomycetia bacterium]
MKSILPFLTLLTAAVASVVAAAEPAVTDSDSGVGDQLMRRAEAAVLAHSSVVAALRYRADLAGHRLFGKGLYWQQGRGPGLRVRLEIESRTAGRHYSCVQIADGHYLWTDWQYPRQRTVHRVDLRRVARALDRRAGAEAAPIAPLSAMGGLPRLLAGLADQFRFAPPQPRELGNLAAHLLKGQRRGGPTSLDEQAGSAAGNPQEHLPGEVFVLLGRDDLFPYVVEYRRSRRAGEGTGEPAESESLLLLELYEVSFTTAIDDRQFIFRSEGVKHLDDTDRYLKRLAGPD